MSESSITRRDFTSNEAKKKGGAVEGHRQRSFAMLNIAERLSLAKDVQSYVKVVTPEAARVLRDTAHFDRQRNISQRNLDRLATEMATGRFTPGTQVYICVLPDGSELIINGNHTLEAIYASGHPQLLTITKKMVANEDEAGEIYAVFDIQKVRTWRDSLRATGRGDDFPLATKILPAVGVIESRFGADPMGSSSRMERINHMEEYKEAAELLAIGIQGAPQATVRMVLRAGIFAVALETTRYQPSFAAEFWGRVAQDDGLSNGMPEKALLSWLRNAKGASAGGHKYQREHCRAAALAWNASFRNERREYVKPNAMGTFVLLGTPWSGGVQKG